MRLGIIPGIIGAALGVLSSPASAHSWYGGLRDDRGILCCNERDCRPVELCVTNGKTGLLIDPGVCAPVRWGAVLPMAAPDGLAHVCMTKTMDVRGKVWPWQRCVILPGAV
jgi:hypothetical protein